jgi:O-antigen/teichoic acid export membrane protein
MKFSLPTLIIPFFIASGIAAPVQSVCIAFIWIFYTSFQVRANFMRYGQSTPIAARQLQGATAFDMLAKAGGIKGALSQAKVPLLSELSKSELGK